MVIQFENITKFYCLLLFIPLIVLVSCWKDDVNIEGTLPDISTPNVILILADDLGFESFEYYGGQTYNWPNLDRLSSRGVVFSKAYATPLCAPSRASLITGQYNFRNYLEFDKSIEVSSNTPSIAKLFKEHGYRTGAFGKWHINKDLESPRLLGFDEYTLYGIGDAWGSPYHGGFFYQNGKRKYKKETYGPDLIFNDLRDFIRKAPRHKFFVYYPLLLPHRPWEKTPLSTDDHGTESIRYYPDMVNYIDLLLGRLIDELEELYLLDDTIIIFTSDNGANRSTFVSLNGSRVYGGKSLTNDFGIHVPLIIYNGQSHRSVANDVIGITDYYATFDHMLNGPYYSFSDGVSFASTFYDSISSIESRDFNYIYYEPKRIRNPIDRTSFIFNKDYKLYDDGRFYRIDRDLLEENQILNPDSDEQSQIQNLRKKMDSIESSKLD